MPPLRAAGRSWRRAPMRPSPRVALFAAARAVRHVVASLKRDNSLSGVGDELMALPDYYALVGLQRMIEREESYDRAGAP